MVDRIPFAPHPVPLIDRDQLAWNARQWAELGGYVQALEAEIEALKARTYLLDSGADWRLWSDGTLEQWVYDLQFDYLSISTLRGSWTFPTPFANAEITITASKRGGAGTATPAADEIIDPYVQGINSTVANMNIHRIAGMTNFASGDTLFAGVRAIGLAP